MIIVDDVVKAYGDTVVVDGVRVLVHARGLTSIIGPNGAGKSTLLSMIARLKPMDSGRVSVDGLDVATTRSDVLAQRLAILRQDNHLDVRLTVRELVTFGRFPHSKGRPTVEDEKIVDDAIHWLDLEHKADAFLDQLSGGQRQRAFVAMVLAQDTEYVLLDEPLNNLDMPNSVSMMKLVRRAADELGRTVVVVMHDINFASCYSDRIIAMKDGRVVAQGTPDEIVTTETLRGIYGLDIPIREAGGHRIADYFEALPQLP
jgi:iron complex transport system ATP-binding protein